VLLFVYRQIVLDRSEFLLSPYIAHCVLYYWILFLVNLKSASSSISSYLIRHCHRFHVLILFSVYWIFGLETLRFHLGVFNFYRVALCTFIYVVRSHHCRHICTHHRFIVVIAFPSSSLQLLNVCSFVSARCIQSSTRSLLAVARSWL